VLWPSSGTRQAHQLEDEIEDRPPTIVIVRRRDDRWLAWSRAEAVLVQSLEPIRVAETVANALRRNPPEDRPR
jgi:hypothetical protein